MANIYNDEKYIPRQIPMSARIGNVLSGMAAPFIQGGQENWLKQQALQQAQAEQDYKQWQAQQEPTQGKNVYTIGLNGELINVGSVPKGSQVIPPSSTTSYQEKADIQAEKSAKIEQQKTQQKIKKMTIEEESKYQAGKSLLDNIRNAWLATNPTKLGSGVGAFAKGIMQPLYTAEQWVGSKLGITPNQRSDKTYMRFINSIRSRLAKGLIGQDVGNLSEYEQKIVSAGVPSLGDTLESGNEILNQLDKTISDMKTARIEGYNSLDEKYQAEGKTLSTEQALDYLKKAGGDKNKAEIMALKDGWYF